MVERNRPLLDLDKKYSHNAWDFAHMPESALEEAKEKLERDRAFIQGSSAPDASHTSCPWDAFYSAHNMRFFRDRRWVLSEFKDLNCTGKRILEIGCGVGNTLSALGASGNDIFGVDWSEQAICIIRSRAELAAGKYAVHDICSEEELPFKDMDFALLVFTLSAIDPGRHAHALRKIKASLKEGGVIYMRDYGLMDMTQLRFKPEQAVKENFYRRGDGTYAYFFSAQRIRELAAQSGLCVVKLEEDRRLLVNRKSRLEMYRCWMQATLSVARNG